MLKLPGKIDCDSAVAYCSFVADSYVEFDNFIGKDNVLTSLRKEVGSNFVECNLWRECGNSSQLLNFFTDACGYVSIGRAFFDKRLAIVSNQLGSLS